MSAPEQNRPAVPVSRERYSGTPPPISGTPRETGRGTPTQNPVLRQHFRGSRRDSERDNSRDKVSQGVGQQ